MPGQGFPFPYELELSYPGGRRVRERDPYSFEPTLGELRSGKRATGTKRMLIGLTGYHLCAGKINYHIDCKLGFRHLTLS